MTKTSITTLIMKRKFDVPAEKVFDAWTNGEMIKKWMFTMEHTNKVAKCDPRVGGTWEIVDHRDGKDYRAIGEYKVFIAIAEPTHLAKANFLIHIISKVLFTNISVFLIARNDLYYGWQIHYLFALV